MNKNFLVSIAMTTYNGEQFLREQLDSIIAQTCTDWELIVCDDCSTDGTWQILQEYADKDARIKIYENEHNLGFKKNFEKAISLCTGNYIALSDQDDIWMKNHIEVLLNVAEEKSAAVGNATIIDETGKQAPYLLSDGDLFFHSGDDGANLFTLLCFRNPFSGAISLYTKELLAVALPVPDCIVYHDMWFSAVACCLNGLEYTFSPLVQHRIHGKNESGGHHVTFFNQISSVFSGVKERKKWTAQRIKICDELISRVPNMPAEKKELLFVIRAYHENRLLGKRIKTILFTIKNYKRIYATENYSQFLLRCIKILIIG